MKPVTFKAKDGALIRGALCGAETYFCLGDILSPYNIPSFGTDIRRLLTWPDLMEARDLGTFSGLRPEALMIRKQAVPAMLRYFRITGWSIRPTSERPVSNHRKKNR
jgi:hypothetical protein